MTRFILLNWLDLTVAQFSSVAQSCLTLWNLMDGSTPGLPPHPSPTTGVYSNSCPSSRSCHATISSSIVTFSSCLQSFPASVSFPLSLFFTSGGQSVGVSASASILPMNIQDWFPSGSPLLAVQGTLKSLLQHRSSNASILRCSTFFIVQLSDPYIDYWKNHSFD